MPFFLSPENISDFAFAIPAFEPKNSI